MYKQTLESIHTLQLRRLEQFTLKDDRLSLTKNLPNRADGLYWLYTEYTYNELCYATSSRLRSSVDIGRLANAHHGLAHVCSIEVNGFRLVYNGIGGVGAKGSGGLRERIQGEVNGGEGTGSLAIRRTSLSDLGKWRFSYVLWSEITSVENQSYKDTCRLLERAWRLQYGWPVLCSR